MYSFVLLQHIVVSLIYFFLPIQKKKVFPYVPDYGYDKYYLNLIWKLRLGMLCIEVNGLQTF